MNASVALVVLAAAAVLGGCGSGAKPTSAQTDDGQQLFTTVGCSTCHTLKAAGASGRVGPDLDRLRPSLQTVEHQVTHGGGGMPAFKGTLSPAQITAVATYVQKAARTP